MLRRRVDVGSRRPAVRGRRRTRRHNAEDDLLVLRVRTPAATPLLFGEESFARLGATAAGFGADPAMFHLRTVLLAFRAATAAGFDAGAQLGARQFEVGAGEARDDAAGGKTDVRAIDAVADALDLVGDVLLAEARIGAGVAGFRAGVTGGDAFDVSGVVR